MIDLSQYKNIHCIGIGGIGLSAIAEIVKQHKNKKHKNPTKIKSLYNFITGQA